MQPFPITLDSAVGDGNLTQSLEPASFAMGWSFTAQECPTPLQNDSNSKSCINLPSRTAEPRVTIVLRHRRENLKKCSLRGLEGRSDFRFFTYPGANLPDLTNYVLLALDGPPLSASDQGKGIFLLDATWRHTEKMRQFVDRTTSRLEIRSIPQIKTAYPRRQEDCADKDAGLASIEALYMAYKILGRSCEGLLDNYRWKDEFLNKNKCDLS